MAILVAGGLYYWFAPRTPEAPEPPPVAAEAELPEEAPVPVLVLPSRAEETSETLVLRGRTKAARNVNVPAETTGLVISQPLRKGAEVEEGQLLCELDAGARAAQLTEAKARLAEAKTEADAATTLSAKGFTSETTRMARAAALEAAQAAVDLVNLDIQRLEIRAPFSGVLETDTAELGSRLGPGETCATVIDLSKVKVEGFVSETNVDKLKVGQTTTARLVNGLEVEGEITFLSRVADPQTRTYEVEVTLPNPQGRIRDGMTAELLIAMPTETAHRIPQTALTLDDEGRMGVRLAENGLARFVPVDILRDEPDGIWVTGLPETAQVIVVGQEFVRDGRAIEPTLAGQDAS